MARRIPGPPPKAKVATPSSPVAASGMPRWRATVFVAGCFAVGIAGVWAGASMKSDQQQVSAQKKLFEEKGVDKLDDTEKQIALLEARKRRLQSIRNDIEKKATRIQDRMDGKPQKDSPTFVSRQTTFKDD